LNLENRLRPLKSKFNAENFVRSFSISNPLGIYRIAFTDPETRVFQAADGEDLMILAYIVFD